LFYITYIFWEKWYFITCYIIIITTSALAIIAIFCC